jgi:hypothetical protein
MIPTNECDSPRIDSRKSGGISPHRATGTRWFRKAAVLKVNMVLELVQIFEFEAIYKREMRVFFQDCDKARIRWH